MELRMRVFAFCAVFAALMSAGAAAAQAPFRLPRSGSIEVELEPGSVYTAVIVLRRGESADLEVLQQGIDVVVDLLAPDGRLLDSVDSPNGRQGPEPVAIVAARTGDYRLRIRPIAPNEPAGRIAVRVAAFRDRAATARLAAERRAVRETATAWLRPRATALPGASVPPELALPHLDRIVSAAQVVGLGEATHGSRELGDFRLSMVRRLVERHGFRLIALEGSASRWRELAPFVAGNSATAPSTESTSSDWIGLRTRRILIDWVRSWNLAHPDDRVRIVGVDPQDSQAAQRRLAAFIAQAYGDTGAAHWAPAATALAAADARAALFANSDVDAATRTVVAETVAALTNDAPFLARRFGAAAVADALATARELMQFADFNSGGAPLARSRDAAMAANLLAEAGPGTKAIYWAHNAHVSASPRRWGPTGALLRSVLGCGYQSIATTFGEGGFLAQRAGDPAGGLERTILPPGGDETIEAVLAATGAGPRLAAWGCGESAQGAPAWLGEARPLRWIGGVFAPDTPPSGTYQPYRLLEAFDAIAYFPRVAAEDQGRD
jgi:erythromycin esterase